MAGNGGKMSPAMKQAGYAPEYANNPQKLKRTKTWQELIDERLSDEKLSRVLDEGLSANTMKPHITGRDDKGKPTYEYTKEPDFFARHRYVETSLKVRNKLVEHHDLTSEGEKIGGFVVVKTVPASKQEDGTPVPVES